MKGTNIPDVRGVTVEPTDSWAFLSGLLSGLMKLRTGEECYGFFEYKLPKEKDMEKIDIESKIGICPICNTGTSRKEKYRIGFTFSSTRIVYTQIVPAYGVDPLSMAFINSFNTQIREHKGQHREDYRTMIASLKPFEISFKCCSKNSPNDFKNADKIIARLEDEAKTTATGALRDTIKEFDEKAKILDEKAKDEAPCFDPGLYPDNYFYQ